MARAAWLVGATILSSAALAQRIGEAKGEIHLPLPIQSCTNTGGCKFEQTKSVLDSNWRWLHKVGCTNSSACNCYLGKYWVNATCSSVSECSQKCALEGEDEKGYKEKYGIAADGQGALELTFVTTYATEGANGTNVGSRMFLLEEGNESNYKMFNLLNREISMTIDNSNLPCGLNAAVYFVEMEADGGVAKHPVSGVSPNERAGAKYGTGYCDAQCPHDIKWIYGEANMMGWNGSKIDPNVGFGHYGTCCAELDIWEANSISTQMTIHSCEKPGYYRCEGVECGDNNGKTPDDPGDRFKGVCDKNGCDFNPYREGAHDFFGPGPKFQVDSSRPVRVVTQFITDDGTDSGKLKEMRRFYIQDNKTIYNPMPSYGPGPHGENYTSLSDDTCAVQMTNFTDRLDVFVKKGGIAGMGEAMRRSMALVFSVWDDNEVGMIWLDATDPYPIPAGKYGAQRGTCNQTSGKPDFLRKKYPSAHVAFSDVRYGEIGSTFGPSAPPPPPSCPGGSLAACISQCPLSPPSAYQACVISCMADCPHARGREEGPRAPA